MYAMSRNGNGNQKIGTIQDNYNKILSILELKDVYLWNVTWQRQKDMPFTTSGTSLKVTISVNVRPVLWVAWISNDYQIIL